jgi:broad specificity phosphatase PhoE
MVSPLTRTLDTCDIILDRLALVNEANDKIDIKARIREELQE